MMQKKTFKTVFIHVDILIILRFLNLDFRYITASTVIKLLHKEMSTF